MQILENLTGVSLTAASGATEFRWTAPEVFKDEQPLLTLKSDVWSFGMTVLEVRVFLVPSIPSFHRLADSRTHSPTPLLALILGTQH